MNPADLLTKGVPQEVMNRHMRAADLDSRGGSTAGSGRELSAIASHISQQVNNIKKIEGLVECITAAGIRDACEDGMIGQEIIWRVLGIQKKSERPKPSEQKWPVSGGVIKMPELMRKEEFPNCFNEIRVARDPKFQGRRGEEQMNRTNNDHRHGNGAKAPRENDGQHHAEVCPLVETAHRDLADHLGLHFREQEQDEPHYADEDECRGNVANIHEHRQLRLHLLVQDQDEPEPVRFERQPDANAKKTVGGMCEGRDVVVVRISGGEGERNREPESECDERIYECNEPNITVTKLAAAGIVHNGRLYLTICCTELVECELRQLFSRGGVSGSSSHFVCMYICAGICMRRLPYSFAAQAVCVVL